MCVCLYQKSVCKVTVPKVCTVGLYNTYESRYLYSLGEYICLLLIVYLEISLICNILFTFLSQHFKAKFLCKEYNLIKVYNKYSRYSSLIIIDNIVLQFP